jgi:WD40 repeat protein
MTHRLLASALLLLAAIAAGCAVESPSPTPTAPTVSPTAILSPQASPQVVSPTQTPAVPSLHFPSNQPVLDLAYSAEGRLLAVAAGDKVHLYDATTLDETVVLPAGAWVNRVAFHPALPLLALAAKDGSIQFWRSDGTLVCRLDQAQRNGATSVAFHPNGLMLASTGNGIVSHLWDISALAGDPCDVRPAGQLIGASHASSDIMFDPGGTAFALVDENHIRLRDPVTRKLIANLKGPSPIFRLVFSKDGAYLAAGETGAVTRVWDLSNPQQASFTELLNDDSPSDTFISSLAFDMDGSLLAAGGSDGMVTLWDLAARQPVATYRHERAVTGLSFSPDGTWLVSGGLDAAVHFWKIK